MADAARFLGCRVSETRRAISDDALQGMDLLVSPEPNSVFSKEEKRAMLDFLRQGGSLFLISDHHNSDRNHDGIDSVGVINQLSEDIAIELNEKWFSEHPITGDCDSSHPIMEGVVSLGTWGGTSMVVLDERAQILARESYGAGYIAIARIGKGRVAVMGDSSPFDDGSGDPGDHLHDGWSNPGFTHERLAYNAMRWLLHRSNDEEDDMQAFSELLSESSADERDYLSKALRRSIRKHELTLDRIKREDVRRTWKEDLTRLERLKSLQEKSANFESIYVK